MMIARIFNLGLISLSIATSAAIVLAGDPDPPGAPNKCKYINIQDPTNVTCRNCPFKNPGDNVMFCMRVLDLDGRFRNWTDSCEDCEPSGPQP